MSHMQDASAESRLRGIAAGLNRYSSGTCLCGQQKRGGEAFCRNCFLRLPENLRAPLMMDIFGEAYELAYMRAAEWFRLQLLQKRSETNA